MKKYIKEFAIQMFIVCISLAFAIIATGQLMTAVNKEQTTLKVSTTFTPDTAGQLMSSAYMKTGKIIQDTNGLQIVGTAYIDIPMEVAKQMVIITNDGYSISNITGGNFQRTRKGFEITVTLKK